MLYFVINRQGQVLDYRIEQGSGHPALDEEVVQMIECAKPLPAMPPSMKKTPWNWWCRFSFLCVRGCVSVYNTRDICLCFGVYQVSINHDFSLNWKGGLTVRHFDNTEHQNYHEPRALVDAEFNLVNNNPEDAVFSALQAREEPVVWSEVESVVANKNWLPFYS